MFLKVKEVDWKVDDINPIKWWMWEISEIRWHLRKFHDQDEIDKFVKDIEDFNKKHQERNRMIFYFPDECGNIHTSILATKDFELDLVIHLGTEAYLCNEEGKTIESF